MSQWLLAQETAWKVALAALSFIAQFAVAPAIAQQPPPAVADLPASSFAPQRYEYDGDAPAKEYSWRRPQEVTYVLIAACGGGGGGAAGGTFTRQRESDPASQQGTAFPGSGGGAAEWRTILVGPLTGDTYKIEIGRGGLGGQAATNKIGREPAVGSSSTFSGPDLRVAFAGGHAGGLAKPAPTIYAPAKPGDSGASSMYGAGGAEGAPDSSGANARSICAGGGGSGQRKAAHPSLVGGNGGSGMMILYPLPNLGRVFEVLAAQGR